MLLNDSVSRHPNHLAKSCLSMPPAKYENDSMTCICSSRSLNAGHQTVVARPCSGPEVPLSGDSPAKRLPVRCLPVPVHIYPFLAALWLLSSRDIPPMKTYVGAFHCVQHKTGVFLHDLLKGLLHRADCIPFGMCTELETKFAVKDTLSFNLWPILSFSYTTNQSLYPNKPSQPLSRPDPTQAHTYHTWGI